MATGGTGTTVRRVADRPRSAEDLRDEVCAVVGGLQEAVGHVLADLGAAIPAIGTEPASGGLVSVLGLDKTLSGRLLRAVRQTDALAAGLHMPGPAGLRIFCKATHARLGRDAVKPLRDAIARYAVLLERDVGSDVTLHTLISGWLPEARRKAEQVSKQQVFKGMCQLFGFRSEASVMTYCVAPGAVPGRADMVTVHGLHGIRRLRDGVDLPALRYTGAETDRPAGSGGAIESLAGEPLTDSTGPVLLTEYCRGPRPEFRAARVGESVQYTHHANHLGAGSAMSYYFAERMPNELALGSPESPSLETLSVSIGSPTRLLHLDLFIRDDVWSGVEPSLSIYWMGGTGVVTDEALQSRHKDRLDVHETLTSLGTGTTRIHSSEVDNYAPMIRDVFARLHWPGERFRGYRCRIQYPVVGSQIIVSFNLPPLPSSGAGAGPH